MNKLLVAGNGRPQKEMEKLAQQVMFRMSFKE
jgi:hypothetical protein